MMMTTTRALAPVAARSASRGVRAAVRAGPSRGFAPSFGARRSVYCKAVEAPVNPTELKPPANLHGFELVREDYVAEYDSKVFFFRHTKTGAEVMSLSNDDENKCFGVTLRTPPANSTGIPHILEHSVLCGSRKYPIKEPFVELI